MSEQERDKLVKASDDGIDDVEAHIHKRDANDEGARDDGDDVEAHIHKKD